MSLKSSEHALLAVERVRDEFHRRFRIHRAAAEHETVSYVSLGYHDFCVTAARISRAVGVHRTVATASQPQFLILVSA